MALDQSHDQCNNQSTATEITQMNKQRFQNGSVIIEVINHTENDYILLTVSKERYNDDAVQVKLDRHIAAALGCILRKAVD